MFEQKNKWMLPSEGEPLAQQSSVAIDESHCLIQFLQHALQISWMNMKKNAIHKTF